MNYDFALITLAQPATSGYLGLFFPPGDGKSETVGLNTAGYPGSKTSGTMWSSACGNTSIDYSPNNAFANVAQCSDGVSPSLTSHHPILSNSSLSFFVSLCCYNECWRQRLNKRLSSMPSCVLSFSSCTPSVL